MKNTVVFVVVVIGYLIAKPMQHEWQMSIIKFVPIVLLIFGIAFYSLHEKHYFYFGTLRYHFGYLIVSLLIILFAFSIINSNVDPQFSSLSSKANRILSLSLFAYFVYLFANILFKQNDFEKANKLLLLGVVSGPGLLILLNIVLYALGINKTHVGAEPGIIGHTPGVLSSLFGFNFNRDAFLFSEHPNNYAVVVGCTLLGLTIVLTQVELRKVERFIMFTLITACFFSLLILDSRSSFASTVIALSAVFVIQRVKAFSSLYLLVLLVPFYPFVIKHFLEFIASFDFTEAISRSGSARDIVTANSRIYIWNVIMDRYADLSLTDHHFFGYGEYGHFGSEDVNKWAWAFGPTVAHNFGYQILYDMGYLGVITFMMIFFWLIRSSTKILVKQTAINMLFLGFVIYYLLSGIFESTFGIYYDMYTTLFFLFVFANLNLVNEYQKHEAKVKSSHQLKKNLTQRIQKLDHILSPVETHLKPDNLTSH